MILKLEFYSIFLWKAYGKAERVNRLSVNANNRYQTPELVDGKQSLSLGLTKQITAANYILVITFALFKMAGSCKTLFGTVIHDYGQALTNLHSLCIRLCNNISCIGKCFPISFITDILFMRLHCDIWMTLMISIIWKSWQKQRNIHCFLVRANTFNFWYQSSMLCNFWNISGKLSLSRILVNTVTKLSGKCQYK